MAANKMAYFAPEMFATRTAMLCGRLHTWLPGAPDDVAPAYRFSSRQLCKSSRVTKAFDLQ